MESGFHVRLRLLAVLQLSYVPHTGQHLSALDTNCTILGSIQVLYSRLYILDSIYTSILITQYVYTLYRYTMWMMYIYIYIICIFADVYIYIYIISYIHVQRIPGDISKSNSPFHGGSWGKDIAAANKWAPSMAHSAEVDSWIHQTDARRHLLTDLPCTGSLWKLTTRDGRTGDCISGKLHFTAICWTHPQIELSFDIQLQ